MGLFFFLVQVEVEASRLLRPLTNWTMIAMFHFPLRQSRGLARRAAESGISVPKLLRAEAVRLAARPSIEAWLTRTGRRSSPLGRAEILAALDEQRRSWPDAGG